MASDNLVIKVRADGVEQAKGKLGSLDNSIKTVGRSIMGMAASVVSIYAIGKALDFSIKAAQ